MDTQETKHVQNISGKTLEVIGYGIVENDTVIEVSKDFNNVNFQELPVVSREEVKNSGIDVEKVEREATTKTKK
jgi:hypothetical protein